MALVRHALKFSKLSNVFDFTNISNTGNLKNACSSISVRTRKHYNPAFKWLRSKKFIPVELPHTEEAKKRLQESIKRGSVPPRYWKSRPLTITSATEILDPYTPEIEDGKVSVLSKKVQNLTATSKAKISDIAAMRKVKNYEPNFKKNIFVQEAQDIYIKAHTLLMEKDPDELTGYVTERAISEMMENLKNKTLKWKFIESLEPPTIVQTRVQEVIVSSFLFAQITVRFHTKQILAIYDRFGRLMFGSDIIAKDVLEYVVFEKHLNNEYGVWKLHGKIIPEWREPHTTLNRTYQVKEEEEEEEDEDVKIHEEDPEPEAKTQASAEIIQSEAKPPGSNVPA